MWQGYDDSGRYPIMIECEYDPEHEEYIIIVTKGGKNDSRRVEAVIPAQEIPKDGHMHIKDVEKSVKAANNLLKQLKKMRVSMEIENERLS